MKQSAGEKAIIELSKMQGVSPDEIRREIQAAIDAGMASPEPAARAFWARMCDGGKAPTPEEVITALTEAVYN